MISRGLTNMDSKNIKRIVADWPDDISYDSSDDKIKNYYSQSDGAVSKRSSIFHGKRLLDIFMFSLALGKNTGYRTPLNSKSKSMPKEALTEEEIWLMTCIALLEKNGDLNVLTDPREIVNICEEYANTGIRKLLSIDLGSSISDPLAPYEELLEKQMLHAAS